jgi:hypothetical protein
MIPVVPSKTNESSKPNKAKEWMERHDRFHMSEDWLANASVTLVNYPLLLVCDV